MIKKIIFSSCFLVLNYFSFAQWSTNVSINTPICNEFFKQNDPRIIDDGKGGAYIAWKDERNGLPDIYLQRINKEGYVLWTLNGISICDDTSDQSTPNLVTDMNGGVIISWSDRRTGIDRDVFVQRVDSNGNELWIHNGVAIATKPNREHNEKICSDGAGGAIIVWEQEDSLWDIWAQRVNQAGAVQWTVGGRKLTTTVGNRINPKIQKDGKGGAIITWQDKRSGEYDIYAQRIDANGNLKWGSTANIICTATGPQTSPKIDPSNSTGGAYITWTDGRNGSNYDIYLQKVDSNGMLLFAANGIIVCNAVGNQSAPEILSNKVEGVIVAWKDSRNGHSDIYAQRIDAVGNLMWMANGVIICNSPNDQINPNMCEDMEGGAIITWQDSSNTSDFDIKAQRISFDGNVLWPLNGIPICNAVDVQKSPKNISDGHGGSIFVWQDKRSGANDIYAHHIFRNGTYIDNTAVQEMDKIKINCYPNPASDFLNIESKQITSLELVDMQGVSRLLVSNPTNSISLNELCNGLYLMKIQTTDQQFVQKKLIIQH